jgi:hypothetical protein
MGVEDVDSNGEWIWHFQVIRLFLLASRWGCEAAGGDCAGWPSLVSVQLSLRVESA